MWSPLSIHFPVYNCPIQKKHLKVKILSEGETLGQNQMGVRGLTVSLGVLQVKQFGNHWPRDLEHFNVPLIGSIHVDSSGVFVHILRCLSMTFLSPVQCNGDERNLASAVSRSVSVALTVQAIIPTADLPPPL